MAERPDGRLQFDRIADHDELIAWSRRYCERAVAVHDVDVDLVAVEWTVSTRARRRAAAVKTPPVPGAAVGDPYDWTAYDGRESDREDGRKTDGDDARRMDRDDAAGMDSIEERDDGPPTCELSLSWAAFDEFDRSEWRDTLRHELIHVEQFQEFGATDHGPAFRERADHLDAAVHCRRFADANYLLRCGECETVVAHRYRASKLVKEPENYRSNCCEAPLSCVEQ